MKQIADDLGVNKMRVYRTISKNNISESFKKGQALYFDEKAKTTIENLINPSSNRQLPTTNVSASVLRSLNEEIASQQEQIERLTQLLDQSQKLQLLAQQRSVAAERKANQMETQLKQIDAKEIDSNRLETAPTNDNQQRVSTNHHYDKPTEVIMPNKSQDSLAKRASKSNEDSDSNDNFFKRFWEKPLL
ncbi:helix-turn-helix domain-containing protein [Lentilactobacillus curieae]|nr:helix-turn-helix domain-containing protein [Lentilactobacillus curieae]